MLAAVSSATPTGSKAQVRLYSGPASHPCAAVEAALQLKQIPYRRTDMLPLLQVIMGPPLYGGRTVPGMRVDGERLVGSRAIMRRLDVLASDPPLLPDDPASREEVLEAERWGDEVFQAVPRRIIDVCLLRSPRSMEGYAAGAKLPLPTSWMRPAMGLTARLMAARNHASDEAARADIEALPGMLDRIDAWIESGLLGGEQPNAADLQIGSSLRLLETIEDLRPLVQSHSASRLTRYFPPAAGSIPAGTLPAQWLAAQPG